MYMPHAGILQLTQVKNTCVQRFWDSFVTCSGSFHACGLISVMMQERRRKRRRRRREEGSSGYSTVPGSACLPEQHSPAVQEGTRRATKSDDERVTDTEDKTVTKQRGNSREKKKQDQIMRTWRLWGKDLTNSLLLVERSSNHRSYCKQSHPQARSDAFTTVVMRSDQNEGSAASLHLWEAENPGLLPLPRRLRESAFIWILPK